MIKLVIFDVGGVLLRYTEEEYARYLHRRTGVDYKKFCKVMMPLLEMTELGRLDVDSMVNILTDRFGLTREKLGWVDAFPKLAKVNWNMARLVNRLAAKKGLTVVLLSDVNKSRSMATRKLVLDRLRVKRVFNSFEMKMRKQDPNPAKRPYRYVLRKMGVKPDETVFVDDREINIIGARAVGINAIRFRSYAQVVRDLKKYGVA